MVKFTGVCLCWLALWAQLVRADDFPEPFVDPLHSASGVVQAEPLAPPALPQPPPPTAAELAATVVPAAVVVQAEEKLPDVVGREPMFQKPEPEGPAKSDLLQRVGKVDPPISNKWSSARAEMHAVAVDLMKMMQAYPELVTRHGDKSVCELRYFSLYGVHPARRKDVRDALNFWVNSMSPRRAKAYKLELVPDTGGLLYRGYLSNYSWTPEAWERVVANEPAFKLPLVNQRDYDYVRYYIGNGLVRADWFIDNCSDTNRSLGYYNLLYASVHVTRNGKKICLNGEPPRNAEEFREAWVTDLKLLTEFAVDKGAIVPDGTSLVAWNNRLLWRVPTILGYYWQTFDVKKSTGGRDFVENRFPKVWDANEYIAALPNGLQAYLLSNAAGTRVEFADPFVASEQNGPLSRHSVLVRTSQSCVSCHATGILPPREYLPELIDGGTDLLVRNPDLQRRIEEFYLSGTGQYVKEDQFHYAKAIGAITGRPPQDTTRAFVNTINSYRDQVTPEQAARECGVTPATLKAALSYGVKGRLNDMATTGRPIPRDTWDEDLYSEAALLVMQWQLH